MSDRPVPSVPPVAPAPESPRRFNLPFLFLVGLALLFGYLFYQLLHPLALPLFFAAVVALLAYPLQESWTRRLNGRDWLAAGLITLLTVVVVVGPLSTAVYLGYVEFHNLVLRIQAPGEPLLDSPEFAPFVTWVSDVTGVTWEQAHEWVTQAAREVEATLYEKSRQLIGGLPAAVIGAVVFVIALFFFLKDGQQIVAGWDELTPLEPKYDRALREEFVKVCRGVVWATVLAALSQGVLFGLGLFLIDLFTGTGAGVWVFVLSLLTVICAMVPFVGSPAVWLPTAAVLFFHGHSTAGVILLLYGGLVVAQVDNVVRMVVLHDQARMHPLLVLVSVLGGIHLMGVLGLFLGPVIGALLFTLLRILRNEMARHRHPMPA